MIIVPYTYLPGCPNHKTSHRCHSQKLRCPKETGIATCTRCLKAGARCAFSPAGPAVRRAAASVAAAAVPTPPSIFDDGFPFHQSPLDDENMLGMQLDWQTLDFDRNLTPPIGTSQNLRTELLIPEAVESSSSTSSPPSPADARSAYVKQLTALAADLDKVYGDMPPATTCHIAKDRSPDEFLAEYSKMFDAHQCLELLFSAGQALLDLYPDVLGILSSEPRGSVECQNQDCIHIEDGSHVPDYGTSRLGNTPRKLDVFLLNLLVLCHARLLDVFGNLLSHAQLCARVATVYPKGKEPRVSVPELKVGKFVASRSSSSTMQAVLLGHIASVLKTRSSQLSRKVEETLGSETEDKQSKMLMLQCQVLEEDSVVKVDELHRIKERLASLGLPI